MKSVRVVIPIYRSKLPELELKLLRHNMEQLRSFDILFIAPISLDISELLMITSNFVRCKNFDVIRVDNSWLGDDIGINGYNKMMLSTSFYELFVDYEYVLICHTDAFIFDGGKLSSWCAKGYDYIGAPWFKKVKYDNIFISAFCKIMRRVFCKKRYFSIEDVTGRVGNGGLSLRRVKSFIDATRRYKNCIEKIVNLDSHNLNNEDLFWALVPREFIYPEYEEAFRFSIDTNPQDSMKMLPKGELPFGCHGLKNPQVYHYWQPILKGFL